MEYVYFIQDENGYIKIGHTKQRLAKRLSDLQTGNVAELRVVALASGDRNLEKQLHHYFNKCRIQGSEWFDPSIQLLLIVETLAEFRPAVLHDWANDKDRNTDYQLRPVTIQQLFYAVGGDELFIEVSTVAMEYQLDLEEELRTLRSRGNTIRAGADFMYDMGTVGSFAKWASRPPAYSAPFLPASQTTIPSRVRPKPPPSKSPPIRDPIKTIGSTLPKGLRDSLDLVMKEMSNRK